ncbi:MAG: hypothetical protein JHC93_07975 [Parachlamydiales bacterium]|nr:hypothetical protein [Parachlamydiales bacterium]
MAIYTDPVQFLPKEIIQNDLAPYLWFNKSVNVVSVCKEWQKIFKDQAAWKSTLKDYSFICSEHSILSKTDGLRAYLANEKIRNNINNRNFKVVSYDIDHHRLHKLGDQILGISEQVLSKFDIKTRHLQTIHEGVLGFTTRENTLIYLRTDAKLYIEEKNKEPILLHENVNMLNTGNAPIVNETYTNMFKLVYIKEYCVVASFGSDYVHVIDKCGVKISKFIPKFTQLSYWNNQIVLGTFDNKIHFYDLDLNPKGCFCDDCNVEDFKQSYTSFIIHNDDLISAGFGLPIRIWKKDGTYKDLTEQIDVYNLGMFDGHLISVGDDMRLFSSDFTFTTTNLFKPSHNMAIVDGKIVLGFVKSSLKMEYNFT